MNHETAAETAAREARMQRWLDRSERWATVMEVGTLCVMSLVMAVLIWEWIKLYRSLP